MGPDVLKNECTTVDSASKVCHSSHAKFSNETRSKEDKVGEIFYVFIKGKGKNYFNKISKYTA